MSLPRPSPGSVTHCWGSSPRPKPRPSAILPSLQPSRCRMSTPAVASPSPAALSLADRLGQLHVLLDQYVSAPTRHDDLDLVIAAVYAVHLGIEDGRPPFWLLFVDPPASG